MKCPECTSTDIKTCKAVYENRDTGTLNANKIFSTNNDLVKRCTPPKQNVRVNLAAGCYAIIIYIVLILVGFTSVLSFSSTPFSSLSFWIILAVSYLLALGMSHIEKKEIAEKYRNWEKLWVCMRCRSMFEIDDDIKKDTRI